VRCKIANNDEYWLVKIARRMMIVVTGWGMADNRGITADTVLVCLIVVKIKPTRIVTDKAVIAPEMSSV